MYQVVYKYEMADLFSLKVTGRNDGRYEAYCKRIGAEPGGEDGWVDFVEPTGTRRDRPAFFETRYFVRCDFHADGVRDAFVNHKMASVAEAFDFEDGTLVGTLDFVNAPGKFCFEIVWHRGGRRESAVFEWMVVSEKLDVRRDYAEIVETIEKSEPGLVRAFLAKSKGQAGLIDARTSNDAIWADIFAAVADRYQKACEWVAGRPHLKYAAEVEYRRAGRVKRWTPALANRYAATGEGRRAVELFRTEHIAEQVDTVESRFVKFTLVEIAKRLDRFAALCAEHKKTVSGNFTDDLRSRANMLARIARKPFFRSVGRFTGFRQESLAMHRKRGYAEVYATWAMLRKTLDMTQTGFDSGHRPISALYEFWCFLKMAEILEGAFGFVAAKDGKRVERAASAKDLFETDEGGDMEAPSLSAVSYEYEEKDGTRLRLLYQQNYSEKSGDGNLAYCNPQRPDIVLVVERGGETFTYLFDAKYRIDTKDGKDASPAGPINDMHRYRDAILYRAQEGERKLSRQIVGAYVLYPGRPEPASFDYGRLIERENIGAIPLLPGADGGKALEAFVGKILAKKTPQAHLGGVIPVRGTSMVVGEAYGEEAVLTVEGSAVLFAAAVKAGRYPVKADDLGGMDRDKVREIRVKVSGEVDRSLRVATTSPVGMRNGEMLEKSGFRGCGLSGQYWLFPI